MAVPPLQQAQNKWQQRQSILNAAGVHPGTYQQLMQKDLQNVQQGGTAMTGAEVKDAILSAATGQSIIGNPKPASGLGAILRNIPTDTGAIIRGFIPGTINFLHHLPSETTDSLKLITGAGGTAEQTALAKKYGFEGYGQGGVAGKPSPLGGLRNFAKIPLVGLVPGITDVANLTSGAGRKQLTQHPVQTALDALPVAKELGEAAAATGALGDVSDPTTAASSLSEGHLGRAVLRSSADTAKSVLTAVHAPQRLIKLTDRAAIAQIFSNMGLSSDIAENIMRPQAQIQRGAQAAILKFFRQDIVPYFSKLTPEERAHLQFVSEHLNADKTSYTDVDGSIKALDSSTQAIVRKVAQLNEKWGQEGERQGLMVAVPTPAGTHEYYPADDRVAQLQQHRMRVSAKLEASTNRLADAADRVQRTEDSVLSKLDKLHRYGESPEAYAARQPELITVDRLRENLVHPLRNFMEHSDSFNHLVDEWVRSDDSLKVQAATRVLIDKVALTGDTGLIAQLDKALSARDFRTAGKLATQIKRIFTTHKSWANFTDTKQIADFATNLRQDLVGIEGKDRASRFAAKRLTDEYAKFQSQQDIVTQRRASLTTANDAFHHELLTAPPARFHPQIKENALNGAMARARQLYHGSQLDAALSTIKNSTVMSELQSALPPGEFNAIMDSAMGQWMDLAKLGHDPLWVHTMQPSEFNRLLHPQVLADHFKDPGMFEHKVMNFTPGVMDLAAGLTSAAQQLIEQRAATEFITQHVMQFARKLTDLQKEYADSVDMVKLDPRFDPRTISHQNLLKEWKPFNPAQYGIKGFTSGTHEELMIPTGVATSLDSMMRGFRPQHLERLATSAAYDKTMRIFKYSVLTGPRHFVHVALGGMLGMMVEDPRSILHIAEAFNKVRAGEVPLELPANLYDISTDQFFHIGVGKSMARHFTEMVGDRLQAVRKWEEHIATSQRLASYISKTARGIEPEVALDMIHHYFIDLDGMTAPERVILKNVFPFYAFTKYLFRYVFAFPVDHPIRAAILAKFANQEQEEWKSGLPQSYQQLFFLGKQHSNGNVMAIDYKNINPFRSFANDMTMSGFFSQLNPIVAAPFELAGFNVLNGTGELYPQIAYDPVTGTLQAKRPTDTIPTLLESFIPETGAIDHFFTITDRMKQLKKYSPQAYRTSVFSQLNLPFAWGRVNVPYVQEKQEMDRYKVASTAVTNLEKGAGSVSSFQNVPYNGQIVPAAALQAYWDQLLASLSATQKAAGTSPKAVMTPPKRPKAF